MKILITGASGFLGRALVTRLLEHGCQIKNRSISTLTLLDIEEDTRWVDPRIRWVTGCISEPATQVAALSSEPDVVFHLAAVASGKAEENFDLGMQINLMGTLTLLDQLAKQSNRPTVVYSSTIAVYGTPYPEQIDETSPLNPALSYGTQKRAIELVLSDYIRRGLLTGCAIRLPGILIRPECNNGALSLFTSQLLLALSTKTPITLPVSAMGTVWLMSRPRCIDNLLWAANIELSAGTNKAVWNLPCVYTTMQEMVATASELFGADAAALVDYQPQPMIEALFASMPKINSIEAQQLGFSADDSLVSLIEKSINDQKNSF